MTKHTINNFSKNTIYINYKINYFFFFKLTYIKFQFLSSFINYKNTQLKFKIFNKIYI